MEQVDQEFPSVMVHKNCRRDFTNSLRKSSSSIQTNESFNLSLRSEDNNKFNWKAFVENSLSLTKSTWIG